LKESKPCSLWIEKRFCGNKDIDKFGGSKKRRMLMSEKFPDIDWYCDECDAYLNDQPGFDDNCGVWVCTECGCENEISEDQIIW
jgi:hypothetical protein